MEKRKYSITDMNGLAEQEEVLFSYGNENGKTDSGEEYSYLNMNGVSKKDDVGFSYTSMNGMSNPEFR